MFTANGVAMHPGNDGRFSVTLWEIGLAGPGDSKSFKTTDSITVRANEPIDFI
ncbi:hypothetical protein RhiirA4_403938, partial [Rhizophagus irregularis]